MTKRCYGPFDGGSVYERTDPDYLDHRRMRILNSYISLSTDWQKVFMDGLYKGDRENLLEDLKKCQ